MTSAKSAHHRPDDAALCVSRPAHDVSAIEHLFMREGGGGLKSQLSAVIDDNCATLVLRLTKWTLEKKERRPVLYNIE